MELRRLRYFLAIAEAGSISKAGKQLGIAQPALSRQIQLIEQEIGSALFDRSRSGMKLTSTGIAFRSAIQAPLRQLEMTADALTHSTDLVQKNMIFGIASSYVSHLVSPFIDRVAKELPHVKLSIVEGHPYQLSKLMAQSEIDMMINYGMIADDNIYFKELLKECLVLIGPYLDNNLKSRTILFDDLREIPLIIPKMSNAIRLVLEKEALRRNINLNIVMDIDSHDTIRSMIIDGKGFTIAPVSEFYSDFLDKTLTHSEITDPRLQIPLHLFTRGHHHLARDVILKLGSITIEEISKIVHQKSFSANITSSRADFL